MDVTHIPLLSNFFQEKHALKVPRALAGLPQRAGFRTANGDMPPGTPSAPPPMLPPPNTPYAPAYPGAFGHPGMYGMAPGMPPYYSPHAQPVPGPYYPPYPPMYSPSPSLFGYPPYMNGNPAPDNSHHI